jgi:hypothetical protein
MKKILKTYSYLIQPTIYKIVTRVFLGTTFALLWNFLISKNQTYIMAERSFFFVGVVLLAMAWFNYLRLDGFSVIKIKKDKKRKNKPEHQSKSTIDFVDEEVTIHELEKKDEIITAMIANAFTGLCFLIPSAIISFKI